MGFLARLSHASTNKLAAVAASLFGLSLVAGVATGWLGFDEQDASGAASSAPPTTSPAQTTIPTPSWTPNPSNSPIPLPHPTIATPTPTPSRPSKAELERRAYATLESRAAQDLSRTAFRGQWVAQLSSKYFGVRDQYQSTESGSHTFRAVDILAEHNALRREFSSSGSVRLLRGQDFGERKTYKGKTFWYTFLLGHFDSRQDVEAFCQSAFSSLSGGEPVVNRCMPRTLTR